MIPKATAIISIVAIVFAVASCAKDESTGPKDKVKPTVSITTPWDGTTRFGIVEVAVEASDDAGINRVELYVNNSRIGTDNTEPYSFEWNMDPLADGVVNTLFAKAVDANGNATNSETVSVTKGVTNFPVATLTGPSDGTTIQQGDVLQLRGTGADEEDGALSDSNITWSSHLQGALGQGQSLDYRGLIIGEHVITLIATDSNGMTDTVSINVTVTENNLPYAVIEKGTYTIAQPLFKKSIVRITRAFYVSKYEVTVQEFFEMMAMSEGSVSEPDNTKARSWADKRNKSLFDEKKNEGFYPHVFAYEGTKDDPIVTVYADYPACFINYIEAIIACNTMSLRDGLEPAYLYLDRDGNPLDTPDKMKDIRYVEDANGWRLPTEAEFEVAARAGLKGKRFPWGDSGPGGLCNSMSDPNPPNPLDLFNKRGVCVVDSYQPNRYGIYNIIGNVAEMCTDMYVGTPPSGVDPVGYIETKTPRYIVKGGAWYEFGQNMQIAMRHITIPYNERDKDAFGSGIGMRVVRNAD